MTYLSSLLSNLLVVLANFFGSLLSKGELNVQISTLLLIEFNPGWWIGKRRLLNKAGRATLA